MTNTNTTTDTVHYMGYAYWLNADGFVTDREDIGLLSPKALEDARLEALAKVTRAYPDADFYYVAPMVETEHGLAKPDLENAIRVDFSEVSEVGRRQG